MAHHKTDPVIATPPACTGPRGLADPHELRSRGGDCMLCARELRAAKDAQREAEKKVAEARNLESVRDALLHQSGLEGRWLRATFETFIAKDDDQREGLEVCRAYAAEFIPNVAPPLRTLWLLGDIGRGKTHLGSAMVNHIIRETGRSARIHSGQGIVQMLRATWGRSEPAQTRGYHGPWGDWVPGQPITEDYLRGDLATCKLLVLDEIGISTGSPSEHAQLFEVLDRRYSLELPTVVISNLPVPEIKTVLGARLYDRLREGAKVYAFKGRSHRGLVGSAALVRDATGGND